MSKTGKLVVSIELDTTQLRNRISELQWLLNSFECVPDHISGGTVNLLDNVVLRYVPATISAGYVNEITFKVEVVGTLDECAAAIRTHNFKLNFVAH